MSEAQLQNNSKDNAQKASLDTENKGDFQPPPITPPIGAEHRDETGTPLVTSSSDRKLWRWSVPFNRARTRTQFGANREVPEEGIQNGTIPLTQQEEVRIGVKFGQWLLFTVFVALLPIVLDAFREISTKYTDLGSGLKLDTLYALVSHGELALICAAVTAEAMGHIFVSGKTQGCMNLFAFGMCCIILFLSAGTYVLAKSDPKGTIILANISMAMFLATLLAGGSCKMLAEARSEALRRQNNESIA